MSNRDLTGDFITDHPLASLGIAGLLLGLVSGISDISAKDRYEVEEMEQRKQAMRNVLIRQNPYFEPCFEKEMIEFIFDGDEHFPEGICSIEHMVSVWNNRHKGFWKSDYRIKTSLSIEDKLDCMFHYWENSSTYEELKEESWDAYLAQIEETLILRGWK